MLNFFFCDYTPNRLQPLRRILQFKAVNAANSTLVINAVCTNLEPVAAMDIYQEFKRIANFYELNNETIKGMQKYGIDENDYVLMIDKRGFIYFSGNVDDCDIEEEIRKCISGKKGTCTPNFIASRKYQRRNKTIQAKQYILRLI